MKDAKINPLMRLQNWWQTGLKALLLLGLTSSRAVAQTNPQNSDLSTFTTPLRTGFDVLVLFGFITGCVMVMGGFLNAKRDENWKMTVIYGLGVAGAVALMKGLFALFGSVTGSGAVSSF